MISERALAVMRLGNADRVEVVVNGRRASTLRFANSVFHQGGVSLDSSVSIRVVCDRRVGVASTNTLEMVALKDCFSRAVAIAAHVRDEPFEVRLPGAGGYPEVVSYFESTARATEGDTANCLSQGFRAAASKGVLQSGSFTTEAGALAVFNSEGVSAYHQYTSAHLSVVSTKDDASGFKSALSNDISAIDIKKVMADSAERSLSAVSPRVLPPGTFRVLLEPPAVAELIYWLSYTGFGARGFSEGTSFLSGRLGEQVTGEGVTIYDDGRDPRGMALPFDMEGVPKKRLSIIEKGVARGVAYDTFTAASEGCASTGHAPFPGDEEGPLPEHLFMEGGIHAPDQLLEMLGTGVLVRSFHYVNGLLNPSETLMTGMTRHGTFYVDKGRLVYPVRSLRFTENILKAFGRIVGASDCLEVLPNHSFPLSSIAAPYLLIDGFSFTS